MTYTASEMRQIAGHHDWLAGRRDEDHKKHPRKGYDGTAEMHRRTAQMLRQAADAMEGRKVLDELGMYDIQRPK